MENKENKTEKTGLNELYKQFITKKAEISEDAKKSMQGGYFDMIVGFMILLIIIGLVIVYYKLVYPKAQIFAWVAFGALALIFVYILYSEIIGFYKRKLVFKREYKLIADTQLIAIEIHERLKELFVPKVREILQELGFENMDKVLFPLGAQSLYNAKQLELPELFIEKDIFQECKPFEYQSFQKASLRYCSIGNHPTNKEKEGLYMMISLLEIKEDEINKRNLLYEISS